MAFFSMDCRVIWREDALAAFVWQRRDWNRTDFRMRRYARPQFAAMVLAALALGACASLRNDPPPSAELAQDDDTYCQSGGKVAVGSPDYVYCRRERDAARNKATAHSDQRQRDLADYMMSHPDHP
jgi:hypothetical protein